VINIKAAEIMGRRRMNQKTLADVTGIRPATIGLLWHGETKRLDMDHLDRLCKALNCQPGDLLEYIPDTGSE